ncbi:MAG: hypothetical protein ACREP9_15285, partial [Candidatus Dormibacteraceae bacterium]
MTTSTAAIAWVNHGKGGELIGTFPYVALDDTPAEVEIYWINDPTIIGLRYPDNSRLSAGSGWLTYRDQKIQARHAAMLEKWYKLRPEDRPKPPVAEKPKLKIKAKEEPEPKAKPKLQLKPKQDPFLERIMNRDKPKLQLKPKPTRGSTATQRRRAAQT